MPLANPWLGEPMPDLRLDRPDLEDRIQNLLSTQNMCVLATAGPAGPLATPVRFFALNFALMFTASPRSPKMRNIAADPRVSIGVFAPLVGLASSRGVQVFGEARLFSSLVDHLSSAVRSAVVGAAAAAAAMFRKAASMSLSISAKRASAV